MIQLHHGGVTLQNGVPAPAKTAAPALRDRTMAYQILRRHDKPAGDGLLHLTLTVSSPTTSPTWASSRPPRPAA